LVMYHEDGRRLPGPPHRHRCPSLPDELSPYRTKSAND
ncbi:hypothetical protein MPH_07512, partial [Macrophomina phaseolina MS6]